ncbi:MAG: hypothetical protein ABW169_14375 [Sphingobium sp.]
MSGLSRRGFMVNAAMVSTALAGGRSDTATSPLMLHDSELSAGRRFAARARLLGGQVVRLDGDRVRQMRDLLAASPISIFAVTQRSDELLIGEIAGEAGYRRVALVRHGADGRATAHCSLEGKTVGTLAQLAGAGWPEAFADLALDTVAQCPVVTGLEPALSWVMIRT